VLDFAVNHRQMGLIFCAAHGVWSVTSTLQLIVRTGASWVGSRGTRPEGRWLCEFRSTGIAAARTGLAETAADEPEPAEPI